MYTIVNGSIVIVCKLNNVRYCIFKWLSIFSYSKAHITYMKLFSRIRGTLKSEFLITFEAWAKLAQKCLVCAPLRIHPEPINKELMLLVTI